MMSQLYAEEIGNELIRGERKVSKSIFLVILPKNGWEALYLYFLAKIVNSV